MSVHPPRKGRCVQCAVEKGSGVVVCAVCVCGEREVVCVVRQR